LYRDGEEYVFMNNETFEQISVGEDILQEKKFYLKENMDVTLLSVGDRVIDIDVPIFVELEIVETEPGVRGNTVSGGSKPAICDTGLKVTVPLFLNVGDK